KILIGENGLGKTTALNMLYYTLTSKFFKLKDFDFKTLELSFTDGQKITIDKDKLLKSDEDIEMNIPPTLLNSLSRSLDNVDIIEISNMLANDIHPHIILDRIEMRRYSSDIFRRYPTRLVLSALKIICGFGEE